MILKLDSIIKSPIELNDLLNGFMTKTVGMQLDRYANWQFNGAGDANRARSDIDRLISAVYNSSTNNRPIPNLNPDPKPDPDNNGGGGGGDVAPVVQDFPRLPNVPEVQEAQEVDISDIESTIADVFVPQESTVRIISHSSDDLENVEETKADFLLSGKIKRGDLTFEEAQARNFPDVRHIIANIYPDELTKLVVYQELDEETSLFAQYVDAVGSSSNNKQAQLLLDNLELKLKDKDSDTVKQMLKTTKVSKDSFDKLNSGLLFTLYDSYFIATQQESKKENLRQALDDIASLGSGEISQKDIEELLGDARPVTKLPMKKISPKKIIRSQESTKASTAETSGKSKALG